jgi:hypothetical protein
MQSFELPEAPRIREAKPIDRRMYSVVPIRAASDKRLRATAWRVLVSVCSYANRAGLCWPGYENLAATHGVTRQAVGRQIKKLIAYGYLQKVKNHSWGRTAQILRVIYDESLSDRQLLERIPFEEKPPGHQWKVLKDAEKEFNNPEEMGTHDQVAITASRKDEGELVTKAYIARWISLNRQAGFSRLATPEDEVVIAELAAAGVTVPVLDDIVRAVLAAVAGSSREPPHRISAFRRQAIEAVSKEDHVPPLP